MKEESRRKPLLRRIIAFGGALALVSGLATAFYPGLAYVVVTVIGPPNMPLGVVYPNVHPLWLQPMIHASTMGMLVSCVGAFLGLISCTNRYYIPRLGFAGVLLGLLGFFLLRPEPLGSWYVYPEEFFLVFWSGPCLTMLGILMMFFGFGADSRVVPHVTLLGCIPLLAAWLFQPLLIAINLQVLIALVKSGYMETIIGALKLAGFLPTMAGSTIGIWKETTRIEKQIEATIKFTLKI